MLWCSQTGEDSGIWLDEIQALGMWHVPIVASLLWTTVMWTYPWGPPGWYVVRSAVRFCVFVFLYESSRCSCTSAFFYIFCISWVCSLDLSQLSSVMAWFRSIQHTLKSGEFEKFIRTWNGVEMVRELDGKCALNERTLSIYHVSAEPRTTIFIHFHS